MHILQGDNFHFEVVARGESALHLAVSIAFLISTSANHWRIFRDGQQARMILAAGHSSDLPGFTRLPPPAAHAEEAAVIAWKWLQQEDYPPEPDHDGSNDKGFRVWCNRGGRIDGAPRGAFVAIEPTWMVMSK